MSAANGDLLSLRQTRNVFGREKNLNNLAKDKKEWARRVRELRTEQGWPIVTKNSGRQDLEIGAKCVQ